MTDPRPATDRDLVAVRRRGQWGAQLPASAISAEASLTECADGVTPSRACVACDSSRTVMVMRRSRYCESSEEGASEVRRGHRRTRRGDQPGIAFEM